MNNVFVFFETRKHPVGRIRPAYPLLKDANVALKLKECVFFANWMDYLGHVMKPGKLKRVYCIADAIEKIQVPTKATEIRLFLWVWNVTKQLVCIFVWTASMLSKRLRKTQSKENRLLAKEEFEPLKMLKEKEIFLPVLTSSKSNGPSTLDTDPCHSWGDCVLLQKQHDGTSKPNWYWYGLLQSIGIM